MITNVMPSNLGVQINGTNVGVQTNVRRLMIIWVSKLMANVGVQTNVYGVIMITNVGVQTNG